MYPEPEYKNLYFNCYRNGDNPVIVFKGLQNGGRELWKNVDADIEKALAWAKKATKQTAQPYRGVVVTVPVPGGWGVFFGFKYILATRSNASCAGVRFERLSDVQKFKAAVSKVM